MQMDDDKVERVAASLEALNARIARLAMALGVALDDSAEVDSFVSTPQLKAVAAERRVGTLAASVPSAHVGADRRKAHQMEELRGLLVLRYHLETTCVTDNGLVLTRQVMVDAQAHLVRQGFKPGADGLGLDQIFMAP